ncbi:hypothetical protein [Streptomyces sp. NBC_01635]|uniref:hypothetical protein n=1 Tax=Streptomyces sp. NBC_01635 TaxID=2975904 RepID=UPI0038700B67
MRAAEGLHRQLRTPTSCPAGSSSFAEYRAGLEAAGFTDVEIALTHPVAEGVHSATIRAVEPAGAAETGSSSATGECCGVNACCTPHEQATDPSTEVAEAKTASGCGCGCRS